jgi:uncharacterized protein (UPF0218 family)
VAYILPDALRSELGVAWGPVVQTVDLAAAVREAPAFACVGDVVSLDCKRLGLQPLLFVCDFATQRGEPDEVYERELGTWGARAFRVRNAAAHITREAWDAVRLALTAEKGPVRIVVEGEEDLLGIPCFLEMPMGSKVLYGMPGRGVVVVTVTPEFQAMVRALLARFEQV